MEKLNSNKLKTMVREELAKFLKSKGSLNEGEAFKPAKVRELVSREPGLQWIVDNENLDLGSTEDLRMLYHREITRNKEMKRKYSQASPQPAGG